VLAGSRTVVVEVGNSCSYELYCCAASAVLGTRQTYKKLQRCCKADASAACVMTCARQVTIKEGYDGCRKAD
jgi:hypothetical protein